MYIIETNRPNDTASACFKIKNIVTVPYLQ